MNTNTPKIANPAIPPPTPPAIAPTFVFLAVAGTAVELLCVGVVVVVVAVLGGIKVG